MIFADGLLEWVLGHGVLDIVRIIASVGGAVVGWFLFDPLTRIGYRVSFKGATPSPLLFVTKGAGAALLAVLIYLYIPLGGSGFGLGGGSGGGGAKDGKGPGNGDKVAKDHEAKDTKDAIAKEKDNAKSDKLETIQIEILGGEKFKDDGKNQYYLLHRKPPPVALEDLDAYFKKHQGAIRVTAITTPYTAIDTGNSGHPLYRLQILAKKYGIRISTEKEE